ncbi:MAG: MBL fold metallo-hydrolase [Clostridia bacterium]|nr:MBL fold metallo-hydrolase [Clostridia bacterium]
MKLFRKLLPVIMVVMMLCGCDAVNDVDTATQSKVQAENINTETPVSDAPREDLEVEVAPGVTSNYGLIRVHFLDAGQADSTFIELGNGQTMLIDAGLSGYDVVDYIEDLHYESIDYVVATHPHDDHIGGMATVLDSFKIGKMYMPKQAHTISAFDNMLDVIEKKSIDAYTAKAGVNITSSGILSIDILAPFADNYSNLNNCSAVVRITYGKTVLLFTGDAEQVIETQLLKSGIDADVLKVGHHGAGSSSAPSFIKAVSPEVAVISCGQGNSYGHPHADTLAILNEVGAKIYRTDEQGTIVVTADQNKKITVDKKASTVKENAPPTAAYTPADEIEDDVPSVNDNQNQVVYRTRTGKKYHRAGCSYLKSIIETTVSEAQSMGLGPCSRCNPPR